MDKASKDVTPPKVVRDGTVKPKQKSRKEFLDWAAAQHSGGEVTDFMDVPIYGAKTTLEVVYYAMAKHAIQYAKRRQKSPTKELKDFIPILTELASRLNCAVELAEEPEEWDEINEVCELLCNIADDNSMFKRY